MSVVGQQMASLVAEMRARCATWPLVPDDGFASQSLKVESLGDWGASAAKAVKRISNHEIWSSDPDSGASGKTLGQAIGQLRALAPIPAAIEPLFTAVDSQWSLRTRRFPAAVKDALDTSAPALPIGMIFHLYKRLTALSSTRRSFVSRVRAAQRRLRRNHRVCRCQWALIRTGWGSQWFRTTPGERMYSDISCPFEVALNELNAGWGPYDRALPGRLAEQEFFLLNEVAKVAHPLGLCRYPADGNVKPYSFISWPCQWSENSPLTLLFDAAAKMEIETAESALAQWLDDIAGGGVPWERHDPIFCTRLRSTNNGLSLLHWSKHKSTSAPIA